MWLKQLTILNFKNYLESHLEFSPNANAFTGQNGAGKTNILDAIHYLSLCKSFFNPVDSQQIKVGQDWFMVQGVFENNDVTDTISCSLKRNQKKQFKKNKKEYGRLADHIGLYPLVMISPNDSIIITEGSEERRKFMDNVISQTDHLYLDRLIAYNRILIQRNSFLKNTRETGFVDGALLSVLDEQLAEVGVEIFEKRKNFVKDFLPEFEKHYIFLSNSAEKVSLTYSSPLMDKDFLQILNDNREKDLLMERTTQGVHRDDLIFEIHEGMQLKKFGSQGQQKSFLIALKLAQYNYLKRKKSFSPLLLLDDIFDKLDDNRIKKLMTMVSNGAFGQIFITDTDAERTRAVFEEIDKPIRIFEVESGVVL